MIAARLGLLAAAVTALGCGGGHSAPPDAGGPPYHALSAYGFFTDPAAQTPAAGVIPYDVNAPLFSDYTTKHRFLVVPPGAKIHYDDAGGWTFPVGTMLVKTFAYLHDARNPAAGEQLLETRILRLDADGWNANTWVWNDAQTDAYHTIAGARIPVTFIDAAGATQSLDYRVPNNNQCLLCHGEHGGTHPLGPRTRQLQRLHDYGGPAGPENEIDHLGALGLFDGPIPAAAMRTAALPDPYDTTGAVLPRARAYLEANCAHCHNPTSAAQSSGLVLTWETTAPIDLGVCRPPFSAGAGTGGRMQDIVPGMPDASIMMFRVTSTDPTVKMPQIPTQLVDTAGVDVLRQWIQGMTPAGCP